MYVIVGIDKVWCLTKIAAIFVVGTLKYTFYWKTLRAIRISR